MEIRVTADIMENEKGDLLLAFHEVEGLPENPHLGVYLDSAILNRNNKQKIIIGNIHNDVRKKLRNAVKILVTEVGSQGIVKGYYAEVSAKH